jgi:hypothetical protein
MKKFITVTIIIICFFSAYYFAMLLPGAHSEAVKPSEKVSRADKSSKEDSGMQEKCAIASKAFFDAIPPVEGEHSYYECHYSKKKNKFFILIGRLVLSHSKGRGTLRTEDLYDVLSNEHYGTFLYQTFVGYRPPVIGWQLFDKDGRLESEWTEAIKPYMED